MKWFHRRKARKLYDRYVRAADGGYAISAMNAWMHYREFCLQHHVTIEARWRGWE